MTNACLTLENIACVLLADAIATCMEHDIEDGRELPNLSGQELTTYFSNHMLGFDSYVTVYCIKFKTELTAIREEILELNTNRDWVEYVVYRSDRIEDLSIDSCDLIDHNYPVN